MAEASLFKEIGDEEFKFKEAGDFSKIIGEGWSYMDFFRFVGDKIVWVTKDCSVVKRDPPDEHPYSVNAIVIGPKNKKKTLEVTATTCEGTASTISGLIRLASVPTKVDVEDGEDGTKEEELPKDITLKCFATTPRAPLATLEPLQDLPSTLAHLRLHFVALNPETCDALMKSTQIEHLELRQVTIEGMDQALHNHLDQGPKSLSLSLSTTEFEKIAGAFDGNSAIEILTLQLHYHIEGESWKKFTDSMEKNKGIQELYIEYLDITDECFNGLCSALHSHPSIRKVKIGFTDNFKDDIRRLTEERRTERTQAVLDLAEANSNLQEFIWPSFQHDEELYSKVEAALKKNKGE